MSDKNNSGIPSQEAREKYNEKRRKERAEKKQGDNFKRDANGEAVIDRYGNPLYNANVVGKKANQSHTKKRNWAFVLYPESAPDDWVDKLKLTGLQCAISPVHDMDKKANKGIAGDGSHEEGKPHYHIILLYSGPTTYKVVKSLTDSLNAARPEPLESVRGYYRYLTHKDDHDKYQYDEQNIVLLNGFNIADFIELTKSEVNAIKRKLQEFIMENQILEYSDLMDYLLLEGMYTEHDVASGHTYFFDKYISSRRNKLKEAVAQSYRPEPRKVDTETGEVDE